MQRKIAKFVCLMYPNHMPFFLILDALYTCIRFLIVIQINSSFLLNFFDSVLVVLKLITSSAFTVVLLYYDCSIFNIPEVEWQKNIYIISTKKYSLNFRYLNLRLLYFKVVFISLPYKNRLHFFLKKHRQE